MKTLALLSILASSPLPEIDFLRLENNALKMDLLNAQARALQAERDATIAAVCAAAKIDVSECVIDPQKRTVSKRETQKKAQ